MDPLRLLTPDESRVQPFLSKYWIPGCASLIGFTSMCLVNYTTRRPVFSGIQKHVAATLSAWFIGTYIEDQRSVYFADRDATLRHYVELHPEDFPAPERKKYKEVFDKWLPIR